MEISPKRNRLRVSASVYGIDGTAQNSVMVNAQDGKNAALDWAAASNFADGNDRLASMLRSGDAGLIGEAVNEILDGEHYSLVTSKWKKKIHVVRMADMPDIAGKKSWDCSISIREDHKADLKVYIHENLHSRSVSYYDPITYLRHLPMEEGVVEYFAQQICAEKGVPYDGAYTDFVSALQVIKHVLFEPMSGYDFAKKMFDMRMDERYTYLVNVADAYRKDHPRMRKNVSDRLQKAYAVLGPSQKGW